MAEENVKVAVRVRPFNARENARSAQLIISMVGNQTMIKDPENLTSEPKSFAFDYSYWSHDGYIDKDGYLAPKESKYADQKKVFDDLGKGVLDNAWKGYNCSLFAYGQTGSGKSYSIVGFGNNKGIVPMACEELFKSIEEKKKGADKDAEFQVTLSMLEIYNEQIRDLLTSKTAVKGGLKVRQHASKGFYVEALTVAPMNSYAQIESKINEGTRNRTVASTNMNATSSRAHTIVALTFTQKQKNAAGQDMTKTAVINLVDLAGSERAETSGATGDRLKEGSSINLSLSTLGNCINALASQTSSKKKVIVPYRDSVLTKLLQNALGGNSKTIMIAAVSPADINYAETLSTLRFADRAKMIKTQAIVNENPTDKLIRELREENQRLLEMLKSGGLPSGTAMAGAVASSQELEDMKKQLEEQMAANQRELDMMKKSWSESQKEAQTESLAKLEVEKKKNEERKGTPHFWNLSEDPALCEVLIHFCREGTAKIGNKQATPAPEILMNGLGIQKEHATVTNKKGTVTIKPLNGAKVTINGKPVTAENELHHNDRVLFGPSHLYVFHHPHDEAKQLKAGKKFEKPTYDTAQEEIAKESGLVDNKVNKSKEELLLNEDLIQVLPMVYEANAMSEELDKKVKFEICLVSPKTRGLKEGMSEVMVQMKNLENGNSWLLPRSNFINRKYLMQEMFQNYTEGDADWNVPKEKDPFWEPYTTPVLIGTSLVYLQPLAYLIDMDESLAVIDWKGKEIGQMLVALVPCDSKWDPLSENAYVEDPKELIGKPYYFKFKIKGARGIPANFEKSSCSYKFYLEDKPTTTQEVKGTMNPDYQHERQISFKTVTDQLITYLTNEAIIVEVWGQQKEDGMRSGSTNSSTKELMMKEKSSTTPTPAGAAVAKTTNPVQTSGGKAAVDLASEIQDRIKKAKAKGIKSVPIEDIEKALAQITGAASSANSKSNKGTSRACLLQ